MQLHTNQVDNGENSSTNCNFDNAPFKIHVIHLIVDLLSDGFTDERIRLHGRQSDQLDNQYNTRRLFHGMLFH